MADARALLKAKRAEIRISHPLATYTASGQLKCIACATTVKQSTAWEGHLGSKGHRLNVVKMRKEQEERQRKEEEERLREEEEERQRTVAGKRKAEDSDEEGQGKRRRVNDDGDQDMEDEEQAGDGGQPGGFPADFFSDPSRAPPPPSDDEEDEHAPTQPAPEVDAEWLLFQQSVLNAAEPDPDIQKQDVYRGATVFAEPELVDDMTEGFPPSLQTQPSLASSDTLALKLASRPRSALNPTSTAPTSDQGTGEPEPLDPAAVRKQRELDDREEIMSRLMDEERAQEEADERVTMLKNRVNALKLLRQAKKGKGKTKS
ncbi:hypothetical protein JAAARDRAFT_61435 [Jaapia argillacea MUCL 33604]|uniref:Uncharacterized protein n=1 Tax=Jaapia argillacea MUCL 33604 TaxID=933084 RepID=A0A067PP98_9AGAM|nr:hypothetical protein JAAARDRAFT_61435 [Jaapia argillacea MUCL 33604]